MMILPDNPLTRLSMRRIVLCTGVYGFPIERASRIAANTVKSFLEEHAGIEKVIFVCFGHHDYQIYRTAIREVFGED